MREATIDIDSFPIEVHGKQQDAAYNGYYQETVYHPIVDSFSVGGDYDSPFCGRIKKNAVVRAASWGARDQ